MIRGVGAIGAVTIPKDAARVDLAGKTIVPGFINAHGHITDVRGLKGSPEFYTAEHITDQLELYARYGITTVFSLGGDGAGEHQSARRARASRGAALRCRTGGLGDDGRRCPRRRRSQSRR